MNNVIYFFFRISSHNIILAGLPIVAGFMYKKMYVYVFVIWQDLIIV